MHVLARDEFPRLLALLAERGHRLIGPTIRDGAIVLEEIAGASDLPIGWTDEQAPGRYRLRRRDDQAYFGFVVGPKSPRTHLTPARERLVQIRRREGDLQIQTIPEPDSRPIALIGVRACELAAIDIQDRVWTRGPYPDPRVLARREQAFVVAVECLEPGELCFCASMGTGPEVREHFDLRLTELVVEPAEPSDTSELEGGRFHFLLEVGSERGRAIADALTLRDATAAERTLRHHSLRAASERMGRKLDPVGLPELLFANLDHPRWQQVADRCLACANCTLVCPTCFCHRVEEHAPLAPSGQEQVAERVREWDSCFTDAHSRIHGAQFRPEIRQRYRQWLTHKLGSWVAQLGSSGCVGCGRCIAWCPVGIDITEEVAALREGARATPPVLPLVPAAAQVVRAGDPMRPQSARVLAVHDEIQDVVTLEVEPAGVFEHAPGQFNMLGLPEIGEVPISISGQRGTALLHTLRGVGATTKALVQVRAGERVTLRGPFGRGWPMSEARGKHLIAIAGGLGLAPMRGALRAAMAAPEHYPFVRVLYGARSPADILYDAELLAWEREHPRRVKVHVTVDHADPSWTGHVGLVTTLMCRKPLPPEAVYLVCGPEPMMRFVVQELEQHGVPPEQIWLSMERNMKCAAGLCGRCQLGPHFICKDGPVLRRDQLGGLFGHEGF